MNIKFSNETLQIIKKYFDEACFHIRKSHMLLGDIKIPSFYNIILGSNQGTQDLTKMLSPIINGFVYGYYKNIKGIDIKYEENGLDAKINGKFIEIKVACSNNGVIKQWTGNKVSNKTPIHLLLGYSYNEETINKLFIAIIDLSKCKNSKWRTDASHKSSFSKLNISIEDIDKIHILVGEKKAMRKGSKYVQFIPQEL